MSAEIAVHGVRRARRAVTLWVVSLGALVTLMMSAYPSVRSSASGLNELLDQYPDAFKAFVGVSEIDYSTGAGYLRAELFGLTLPLLLIVLAIGRGADAIGGEEERGTLALLLAQPVSRTRLLLEQAGAVAAIVGLVALGLWGVTAAGATAWGLDVALADVAAGVVLATLLAYGFGALALLAGALTGSRGRAIAVAAAAAVATYLGDSLAEIVSVPSQWRWLSPFAYYRDARPLGDAGFAWVDAAVLAAFAAFGVGAAVVALRRRDVAGG